MSKYPTQKKILPYSRYIKRVPLHFWIDYFKASIIPTPGLFNSMPKLLRLGLSVNSSLYTYDKNTYLELKNIEALDSLYSHYIEIKDKKTNKNLGFFMIARIDKKIGAVQRDSIIEITGTGVVLRNLDFYFKFLKWSWYSTNIYKRVDLCLDMAVSIDYITSIMNKNGDISKKSNTPIHSTWWVLETWYIWNRNRYKNTFQLIRVYNKKLDNSVKWKDYLYPQYDKIPYVTRIEIEFRRDKAKFFDDEKLQALKYQWGLLKGIIYPYNWQFFKFMHYKDFEELQAVEKELLWKGERQKKIKELQRRIDKYWNPFKDDLDKRKWKAIFITYAKKLMASGCKSGDLVDLICNSIVYKKDLNRYIRLYKGNIIKILCLDELL